MTNAPAPPQISRAAIWSLVLGILSITCLWILGSIPAIILGVVALKKIGRSPESTGGRGQAIAGIITGGVGIVAGLIPIGIVASIALPAFAQVKEESEQITEMKLLNNACKIYAIENNNEFPPSLQQLFPDFIENESLLTWEDKETGQLSPYLYRAGLSENSSSTEPLILAPVAIMGERPVVYVNGIITVLDPAPAKDVLQLFE
tara:strand:+ start:3011 stop:3622 length:612 start_codon:yes stop_codon:yes gene_type:complete